MAAPDPKTDAVALLAVIRGRRFRRRLDPTLKHASSREITVRYFGQRIYKLSTTPHWPVLDLVQKARLASGELECNGGTHW
jgi:hypothetical protein